MNTTSASNDNPDVSLDRVLFSADDALRPPPQLEWCVEGLLAQPSLTMLVGDPGSKKTFLAIDLAVCVALGKPWLGHQINPVYPSGPSLTEPVPSQTPAKQGEGVGVPLYR